MSNERFHSFRKESHADWGRNLEEGRALTEDQIQLGAILRIADAVEKVSNNVNSLIERNVRLSRENDSLRRSNAAYRGLIRQIKKGDAK